MASVTARYRTIAEVLVRNGLSALAGQLGLLGHAASLLPNRRDPAPDAAADGPARLRRALEELGPTFIKLGQMLSTRPDLLPAEYTAELATLQSRTSVVSSAQIVATIEQELGAPVDQLFARFEETPLASASIGQAHRARTHDGVEVVVKVRKPGVSDVVSADLEALTALASLAAREWELARDVDVEGLVAAFGRSLRGELDYRVEAQHAQQLRENLADDPWVRVPAVLADLTTAEVLTEELVTGMAITDTAALAAAGLDSTELAHRATASLVRMVLVDGFFHADPHPGNLFVGADGVITLIDFGMVGRLGPAVREDLLRLLYALRQRDAEAAAGALLRVAPPRRSVDRRRLSRDALSLMDELSSRPLAEIRMASIVERLTALLRRHRLQLPPDVSTLLRMLVLTESSAVALDPDFHVSLVLDEVAPLALMELLSPEAIARRLGSTAVSALRVGTDLPQRATRLLDDYEARGVDVRLHPEDLERIVERLEGTADRLIVGMSLSGLLVSIGTVLASRPGRAVLRDPLMLGAGGAVALMGAYLAAGAWPARKVGRFVRRGISRG